MAARDREGGKADRKPTWPLLLFSLAALIYFGYGYIGSFRSSLPLNSIGVGIAVFGLTFGLISQVRLSGLPDTMKEGQTVRAMALPSGIAGLVAAVGLFVIGM